MQGAATFDELNYECVNLSLQMSKGLQYFVMACFSAERLSAFCNSIVLTNKYVSPDCRRQIQYSLTCGHNSILSARGHVSVLPACGH